MTREPQTSLYSRTPSVSSLPVLFPPSCIAQPSAYMMPIRPVAPAFIITPEMSAQATLCHLPELLRALTVTGCMQANISPDGGNDIFFSQDGKSCHLAKPSAALYTSDLHVSPCSKYNPQALVDEHERSDILRERKAWERREKEEKKQESRTRHNYRPVNVQRNSRKLESW